MTMANWNNTAMRFAASTCICLLLGFAAPSALAQADPEQACGVDAIRASFDASQADQQLIRNLQELLKTDGLLEAESSGELDDPTLVALAGFCARLAGEGKPVPSATADASTGDLAAFLENELIAYRPVQEVVDDKPKTKQDSAAAEGEDPETAENGDEEPAPCELESIQARFNRSGEKIEAIQQLLKAGGYLTDRVDRQPGPRTHHALYRLCRYLENTGILRGRDEAKLDAIDALEARLADEDSREKTAIELQQQANRVVLEAVDSSAAEPVAGCGCSRDFGKTAVVGFLPYWLGDSTSYGVDFSVLDRIGFHALQLDQLDSDGRIEYPSLWSEGNPSESYIARFIGAAASHKVKVDLTFYSANWMNQGFDVERAASAVQHAMSKKFSDISDDDEIGANLLGLLRKLLPFVGSDSNLYADGINLYFDNYREKKDATKIVEIVNAVGRRVPDKTINIILDPDWRGLKQAATEGTSAKIGGIDKELFTGLKEVLKDGAKPEVANLMVLLPRSTKVDEKKVSHARKLLRRAIEDAFDGDGLTRRTVLRKTVPIIVTFDDHDQPEDYFATGKSSFVDDLIYLQDNFAGVGLWPLPLLAPVGDGGNADEGGGDAGGNGEPAANGGAPPNDGAKIGKNLINLLEVKADWRKEERWEEIDNLIESTCESVCPNRWKWRIAFDVLAALLVIYWLLALWDCRLFQFYQRHRKFFLLVVVLTASILAIGLVCDPFWKERRVLVLIGLLLLVIVGFGWPQIKQRMLPRLP